MPAREIDSDTGAPMSESKIMIVEDDADLREALCDTLDMAGFNVVAAADGPAALRIMDQQALRMVISDIKMEPMDGHHLLAEIRRRAQLPVLLMTAFGDIQQAVRAMQEGAVDYLVKPFEVDVLISSINRYLHTGNTDAGDAIAEDDGSKRLLALADRVADSEATVLITGDSGTGKEVLAQYIHQRSARKDGPFVAVNCAAIPETMLEATLFGYQKGAFTGAYQTSPGKFERAQGGTLLLDEISEMDLGLQAKLLRVLQEREVERLGGARVIALDVRVLATSNRSLPVEVENGRFREDLYYRLNVFPLHLPPLRDRPGDILPLAKYFLTRHAQATGQVATPELSEAAARRLLTAYWPGNVRELENLMHRALILSNRRCIEPGDLQAEFGADPVLGRERGVDNDASPESLDDYLKSHEEARIMETLKSVNGSRDEAAKRLGISARTLRYKLAKMRAAGVPLATS